MRNWTIMSFSVVIMMSAACSEQPRDIIYADIVPDLVVTSMITFPIQQTELDDNGIIIFSNQGAAGVVGSATAKQSVDVNGDKLPDYDFIVRHSFKETTPGQTDDEFTVYIGSAYGHEVSLMNPASGEVRTYQQGESFLENSFGASTRFSKQTPGGFLLQVDGTHAIQSYGEYYVAIRMHINGKSYYGWIWVSLNYFKLTVKATGLRNLSNVAVKAGAIL